MLTKIKSVGFEAIETGGWFVARIGKLTLYGQYLPLKHFPVKDDVNKVFEVTQAIVDSSVIEWKECD